MLTAEPYPRLLMLRLTQRRGYSPVTGKERWFGPFTRAGSVRDTLRLLGKIFPLRRCRQSLTGEPTSGRPCLNYQMGRCLAPCRGKRCAFAGIWADGRTDRPLPGGRTRSLEEALTRQMEEASQQRAFERAARLRDQPGHCGRVVTRSKGPGPGGPGRYATLFAGRKSSGSPV